jgi:hypothetical protein
MKKITPNIDLQNSIQRDRILESRDFYKGKSFRYSEWRQGHTYYNDEWYTDFVSYEGVLLACQATHPAVEAPEILRDSNNNPYGVKSSVWSFVMAGMPGPKGQVYVPYYDETHNELTWKLQDHVDETPIVIKNKNTLIRFANELPPNPKDYQGQILILDMDDETSTHNKYLEYVAVRHGDEDDYSWELIGGDSIDLNKIQDTLIDAVSTNSDIKIEKDKDGNMSLKLKEDIKPV